MGNDARTIAAWTWSEPGIGARDARDVGAGAEPPRSRDAGDPRRHAAPARLGRSAPAPVRSASQSPGTGTSGMEAAVANVTAPGARVLVVVTGYFGDRLAQIFQRYGAEVTRHRRRVGTRLRPGRGRARARSGASRHRRRRPRRDVDRCAQPGAARSPRLRRAHGALTVVDAVTSFGAMPLETGGWGIDVCYSCSQKGLGAPSGLAPLSFSARALREESARRAASISIRRFSRTTGSAASITTPSRRRSSMPCAKRSVVVEEEGLEQRWARHERNHQRAGRRARGDRAVAVAAGGRATLDAERRQGARRHRRSRGPAALARRVQHRDRRRPRAARRTRSGESD